MESTALEDKLEPLYRLGKEAFKDGREPAALEFLRGYLKHRPQSAYGRFMFGECLRLLGRPRLRKPTCLHRKPRPENSEARFRFVSEWLRMGEGGTNRPKDGSQELAGTNAIGKLVGSGCSEEPTWPERSGSGWRRSAIGTPLLSRKLIWMKHTGTSVTC